MPKLKCTMCFVEKDQDHFHLDKKGRGGRHYWCKQCRSEQMLERNRLFPWEGSYRKAKDRCLDTSNNRYQYYGGRGIKFLMSKEDFKNLWFRDKAYNMKKPTIDRKDNDKNYTLENCRFIEKSANSKKRWSDLGGKKCRSLWSMEKAKANL